MMRCNCESSFCKHHNTELRATWPYTDNGCYPCSNDASNSPYTMEYVGKVCIECAEATINSGGAKYMYEAGLPVSDLNAQ